MSKISQWEQHDPAWLVCLARVQLPQQPEIAEALVRCVRCVKRSIAYWYFVDPTLPNQPGSDWQFSRNIQLNAGKPGSLILDVLKDGRIGGVEFLDEISKLPRGR